VNTFTINLKCILTLDSIIYHEERYAWIFVHCLMGWHVIPKCSRTH